MKAAIVYGGYSSERKASEENAIYIEKALRSCGHETQLIPYETGFVSKVKEMQADMVFVCVQGKGHGDGTIQAILEHEKIPFTGSASHAAALINDKIVSKLLFEQAGIRTPKWQILTKEDYKNGRFDADAFGYPFVAKAPSEGGSFGIVLIRNKEELPRIEEVFSYESPILIEEFISGDFYTVGILETQEGRKTLPCVQGIELGSDGENSAPDALKVFTGDYTVREADLPKELLTELYRMAERAFSVMGARDIARIDFMVEQGSLQPYVLEINAVPGLKPRSLFPGEAKLAGISYEELIGGILLTAWEKRGRGSDRTC